MGILPYVFLLIVAGWLGVVALNRRSVPGAYGMGTVFLIMAFSVLSFIFEMISPTLKAKVFWDTVQYICLIAIPLALAGFTIEFTGKRIPHPRQTYAGMAVLPLISLLLIVTNNFTENLRPDARLIPGVPFSQYTYSFGIQDYFCQFYFSIYILAAAAALFHFSRTQPPAQRRQTMAVVIGILFPLAGGLLTLLGVSVGGNRDLTPFSYALFCLITAWGLFRLSLFKTISLAHNLVFEKIKDAVLAVDRRDLVVDYNPSALALFDLTPEKIIGMPVASLVGPCLPPEGASLRSEFQLETAYRRAEGELFLRVNSIPLPEFRRQYTGRLLIFHDVTQSRLFQEALIKNREALEQQVLARTNELAETNRELQSEINIRKQAELEKDKSSRDLEALYQMAVDLADLSLERNLDEYLALKARSMTGAFMAVITEYEPEQKQLAVRYVAANSGVLQEIAFSSGVDLNQLNYKVSDETYREMMEHSVVYRENLSESAMELIPMETGKAIKNIFRIDQFISMVIHDQENVLGTVTLAIQKGRPLPAEKTLLAFSHLAAIALRKRKAEISRQDSETRFRELTDLLPQPAYECDLTGKITFANRKAFEMFGVSFVDLNQGLYLQDFVVPEQRDQVLSAMRRASISPSALGREFLSRRKDGSTFPVLVYTSAVERDQKVVGLRGVSVDISAIKDAEEVLRASEEKFRAIVEQMSEGFLLVDGAGKVRYINAALEKITGISRAEIIGHPFWLFQSRMVSFEKRTPEYLARLKAISLETLRNHTSDYFYRPLDAELQMADGSSRFIQQVVFPINTQKEYLIGSIVRDVTVEKEARKSLEQYARRMELLHHIDQSILSARSPEEIAGAALEEISRLIPVHYSSIFLTGQLTREVRVLAEKGETPRKCPFTTEMDLSEQLMQEDFNHIPDVCQSPLTSALCENCSFSGSHSLLSLRMKISDQWQGSLFLCSLAAGIFDAEHLQIGREIADQLSIAIRQADLFNRTQQSLEREKSLNRITHSISSSFDIDSTIPAFLQITTDLLGADGASLTLLSDDKSRMIYPEIFTYPAAIGKPSVQTGRGLGWKVVSTGQSYIVDDYSQYPDALPEWVNAGVRAIVGVPVKAGDQILGSLGVFRFKLTPAFSQRDQELIEAIARQAGMALHNSQMYNTVQATAEELARAYDATIQGWSRALELRDKETQGHSNRVTELSVQLAEKMGMPPEEIPHFMRGVFLHDIGKMGIPDSILLKPGPLTPDEWVVMRQHPEYARQLLSDIPYLRPALDVPYCHHERWDGSGYPRGLRGEEIPLGARVFAVVDVWDALISDRPYRPAWTQKAVEEYLLENIGKQFDPRVVNVFLQLIHDESSNT